MAKSKDTHTLKTCNVVQLRLVHPRFSSGAVELEGSAKHARTLKLPKPINWAQKPWSDPRDPASSRGRYFGIEFTPNGKYAAHDAIEEATGLNYVLDMMSGAMYEFGKRFGVPYCYTYGDDALIYTLNGLGIDHKQFEQFAGNVRKRPLDSFVVKVCDLVKRGKMNLLQGKGEVIARTNRSKLWKAWRKWMEADCLARGCPYNYHGPCDGWYQNPDLEKIAAHALKRPNEQRSALKLVGGKKQ